MFQVVEQLNVSPALVSYLNTEVAGQLRGKVGSAQGLRGMDQVTLHGVVF